MVRRRSAKRYYKPIRGYDRSRCTRFTGRCDLTGCNRREGSGREARETERFAVPPEWQRAERGWGNEGKVAIGRNSAGQNAFRHIISDMG